MPKGSNAEEETALDRLINRTEGQTFAVIIDNNYLIHAFKKEQFGVDYAAMRDMFMHKLYGVCSTIHVIVAVGKDRDGEARAARFVTWLQSNGFDVTPCYYYIDQDNGGHDYTSLKVMFATYFMHLASSYKNIIMVADNHEYVEAIKLAKTKGVTVTHLMASDASHRMNSVANFVVNFTDPSIASLIEKQVGDAPSARHEADTFEASLRT